MKNNEPDMEQVRQLEEDARNAIWQRGWLACGLATYGLLFACLFALYCVMRALVFFFRA